MAQEKSTLPAETFKSRLLAIEEKIEEMIDENQNSEDRLDE